MYNTLKSFVEHASRCHTRGNDFVCRETDLRNCRTFTVNMAPLCYKLGKSYVAKESAWLVCTAISSLVLKCRLVMRSRGKDGERKRKFRQARSCMMGRAEFTRALRLFNLARGTCVQVESVTRTCEFHFSYSPLSFSPAVTVEQAVCWTMSATNCPARSADRGGQERSRRTRHSHKADMGTRRDTTGVSTQLSITDNVSFNTLKLYNRIIIISSYKAPFSDTS